MEGLLTALCLPEGPMIAVNCPDWNDPEIFFRIMLEFSAIREINQKFSPFLSKALMKSKNQGRLQIKFQIEARRLTHALAFFSWRHTKIFGEFPKKKISGV
jgi:hypothetical protein